ncbi:MAG: rhomboid family intramembrane serine protease [Verrucomicrobiaceae bacterium]|nr:rhomboid family intramembrane serine protease [Verrucomicrobiaceae bacterium]
MRQGSRPSNRRSDWPRLTVLHAILALNILAYFLGPSVWTLLSGEPAASASTLTVGKSGGISLKALAEGKVWTLLTHMFLHSGPMHLLGNLVITYLAGVRLVELLGNRLFLIVYFVGGLVGALFQVFVDAYASGIRDVPIFGSSACACAVGFALAAVLPQENVTTMFYFIFPVHLRLWTLAVGILVLEIALGLSVLMSESAASLWGGNAYFAHIGGALLGWYVVRLLGYGGQPMTYARLWHQQEGFEAAPKKPAPRAMARMRRLEIATPEMDHDAIRRKREAPGQSDLPIIDEVNDILDKINREGLNSLSEKERRVLESASRDLHERGVTKKSRPTKRG